MNLTDLREELSTHADDLGPSPDLRAGVAARVGRTKRRRATAAGAGAALAVAALALGVMTSVGRPAPSVPAGTPSSAAPLLGADGMPFRTVPDAPGDVVKAGLRFREQVADDHLVAGVIGDLGENSLDLSWTPTTTHVSYAAECYLPGATPDLVKSLRVRVDFGAAGFVATGCSPQADETGDLPAGGATPGEPGKGDPNLTVGKPASVRVELVDGSGRLVTRSDARIVGAVYELGLETPIQDASGKVVAVVPDAIEHQGYIYSQVRMSAAPLRGWQDITVGVDPGPAMVAWGSAGDGLTGIDTADGPGMRLARFPGESQARGYGSWGPTFLPADSTLRVTLSAQGKRPDKGVGFVAVYALAP